MTLPNAAVPSFELLPGAVALPQGLLFLTVSRTLVAADVHLAYEDVIGGALPLWSTAESLTTLLVAIDRTKARELVLLGDIIHGSRMSQGAARVVGDALDVLRSHCAVTLVAGNHEGRTRGSGVLGETHESIERDGWLLLHGDRYAAAARCIIGHLHPSIALGGERSAPAFLASPEIIVVPALTPYSRGLNVLSGACAAALKAFVRSTASVCVVACGEDKVYPFGSLAGLRTLLRSGTPSRFARRRLNATSSSDSI